MPRVHGACLQDVHSSPWFSSVLKTWLLPGCSVCGAVSSTLQEGQGSLDLCVECSLAWASVAQSIAALGLDSRQAIWLYEGSVRRLIVQAKDVPHCAQAHALLRAALEAQRATFPKNAVWTTPPPSTKRRLQDWYLPQFLAAALARSNGQKCIRLLRRRKQVQDQAELGGARRRHNLQGVYAARRGLWKVDIPDCVVLFDDVSTTGATMQEAARALRAMGVQEVHGFSVAVVA